MKRWMDRGRRPRHAGTLVAGAVTGVAGVAVGQVVTSLLNARATPVQGVAEVVIAKTPGPIAEALIRLVGRNDKPILIAGVTLAIVGLGAVAGLLTARRAICGHLVFLAMAAGRAARLDEPSRLHGDVRVPAGRRSCWCAALLLDYLTGEGRSPRRRSRPPAAGSWSPRVAVAVAWRVRATSGRCSAGAGGPSRQPGGCCGCR